MCIFGQRSQRAIIDFVSSAVHNVNGQYIGESDY